MQRTHTPHIIDLRTHGMLAEDVAVGTDLRLRGHGHAEAHLCVVLDGELVERNGRTHREVMRAGTVRISPAGDEHDLRFGAAGASLLLVLLRGPVFELEPPSRERRFVRAPFVEPIARRAVAELRAGSPLHMEAHVLELLARLRRGGRARASSTPPAWLTRVRDAIEAAPDAPPDSATLAAAAGLHPVYVARAFRGHFGVGMAEYARRVRLERARRMIVGSATPLSRVAAECGFADQSHLTRALRDALGTTPALLRARGFQPSRRAGATAVE